MFDSVDITFRTIDDNIMVASTMRAVLWTALILAPVGPFAVRLGILLNQKVSALWFYRVCYFGLVISSLRLLIIGMTT